MPTILTIQEKTGSKIVAQNLIFVKNSMMKGPFEVIKQLMYLLFVILGGMLLAWLLTIFVLLATYSFDLVKAMEQSGRLLEDTGLLRLTQAIQSFSLFVLPPFFMALLNKEKPVSYLGLQRPNGRALVLGILSIVTAIPLINVLVSWNEGLHLPAGLEGVEAWMRQSEATATALTEQMLSGTSWLDLTWSLLIIAILAGFGEELFFRGLLQQWLGRLLGRKQRVMMGQTPDWVKHLSIWVVAFVFSAIHLQFFGFFPRLLLGAWFGYLLWWSGSVWVPVAAHMTNNALSALFLFAENKGWLTGDPDNLGLEASWWLSPLSLVALTALALLIRQGRKRESATLI
jgi:membrane protease YdiL (CAAX protease family)